MIKGHLVITFSSFTLFFVEVSIAVLDLARIDQSALLKSYFFQFLFHLNLPLPFLVDFSFPFNMFFLRLIDFL